MQNNSMHLEFAKTLRTLSEEFCHVDRLEGLKLRFYTLKNLVHAQQESLELGMQAGSWKSTIV